MSGMSGKGKDLQKVFGGLIILLALIVVILRILSPHRTLEAREAEDARHATPAKTARLASDNVAVRTPQATAAALQTTNTYRQEAIALRLSYQAKKAYQDGKFDLGLLLSVEAAQRANIFEARDNLLSFISQHPRDVILGGFTLARNEPINQLSLAFSPDGRFLATGGCQSIFHELTGGSNAIAYEHCAQGQIRIWHATTGQLLKSIQANPGQITHLNFTEDSRMLVSGTADHAATEMVWDTHTWQQLGSTITDTRAVLSPDGKVVASTRWDASVNEGIIVLKTLQGEIITELLKGEQKSVQALKFSPKGVLAYSYTLDDSSSNTTHSGITLWDVNKKQSIAEIPGGGGNITFNTTGNVLAITQRPSPDSPGKTTLWNLADQTQIIQIPGKNPIFSPDDQLVATLSGTVLSLWNANTGDLFQELPAQNYNDSDCNFNLNCSPYSFGPNGQLLAVGQAKGTVDLWDLTEGYDAIKKLESYYFEPIDAFESPVWRLAFSPNSEMLAVGGQETFGRLFNIPKIYQAIHDYSYDGDSTQWPGQRRIFVEYGVHSSDSDYSTPIVSNADGSLWAIRDCNRRHDDVCEQYKIVFWDSATLEPRSEIVINQLDGFFKISGFTDGQTLLLEDDEIDYQAETGTITWLEVMPSGQQQKRAVFTLPFIRRDYSLSPDGQVVAIICDGHQSQTCQDGDISLWQTSTGQHLGNLSQAMVFRNFAFSPNSRRIATLHCPEEDITEGNMASDNCASHQVDIWDVERQEIVAKTIIPPVDDNFANLHGNLSGPGDLIDRDDPLFFSPDSQTLALYSFGNGGGSGRVILLDANTGDIQADLFKEFSVKYATFSPDTPMGTSSQILAVADRCGNLHLWDIPAHRLKFSTAQRRPPNEDSCGTKVTEIAFSPDNQFIAVGERSFGNIRLLDINARQYFEQDLIGHRDSGAYFIPAVSQMIFNQNGWLVSTGQDGIIAWDLRLESWLDRACQLANRNLTRAEWEFYVGDEDYRATCEDIPLD
jgi:WD40 repeat protein